MKLGIISILNRYKTPEIYFQEAFLNLTRSLLLWLESAIFDRGIYNIIYYNNFKSV